MYINTYNKHRNRGCDLNYKLDKRNREIKDKINIKFKIK